MIVEVGMMEEDDGAMKWGSTGSVSTMTKKSINPIREIVDKIKLDPNPELKMIPLSIGDPSVYGNFPPSTESKQAVIEAVEGGKANGYLPSMGSVVAREAVAKYVEQWLDYKPDIKAISFGSGASGAIEFAISALANPGDNIVIPRPGFPLYEVLAGGQGIDVKYYDLDPEKTWEVDVDSLEAQIDHKTAAIVFINPSNPCGAVWTKEHVLKLIAICERQKVPIIADEIYAGMIFKGNEFHSFCKLSKTVPVIACGGIAKRFLVPGWRLGWTIAHDPANVFNGGLNTAIHKLTTRLVGPNALIQAAIPKILNDTPESWHELQNEKLGRAAMKFYNGLLGTPGLNPILPQGAMYMMVGIDMTEFPDFKTDMDFVQALIKQKSIFCLPGKCFGYPNYFRIVITIPENQIEEAVSRIKSFCEDSNQVFQQKKGFKYIWEKKKLFDSAQKPIY